MHYHIEVLLENNWRGWNSPNPCFRSVEQAKEWAWDYVLPHFLTPEWDIRFVACRCASQFYIS